MKKFKSYLKKEDIKKNIPVWKQNKIYILLFLSILSIGILASVCSYFIKSDISVRDALAYQINIDPNEGFNIIELDEHQFKVESNVPFQCTDDICNTQEYCPVAGTQMSVKDLEGPTNTDLMVLGIGMSATNLEQNFELTHSSMGYLNSETEGVDCGQIDFRVNDSGDWTLTEYGGDTPAFLRNSEGECNLVSVEPLQTDIGVNIDGNTLATVVPDLLVDECSSTGYARYENPAGSGLYTNYVQVATLAVGCFQNESDLSVNSLTDDLDCTVDPDDANHVYCTVDESITDPTIKIGYEVSEVDYWMRGKTFYGGHATAYPGYEGALPDVLYQNSFGGIAYTELEFDNLCRTLTLCGDGIVQNPNDAGQNEQCDDGNNIDGDGCNADCTLPTCYEVCNDSYGCNDSYECQDSLCVNPTCPTESDCVCADCGDGNLDEGEECDDGNTTDGDGCDSDCTLPECQETCTEEYGCEDGMDCLDGTCVNPTCPEDEDCTCDLCGNGELDEGEECDDGNNIDGDGCDSDCTLPGCQESCTEEYGCEEGMECEDGTCINPECPEDEDCSCELCGDGQVQAPETWDEPWGPDETPATGFARMQVDIYDCCETQQGILSLVGPDPSEEVRELSFRETEWTYIPEGTYSYTATPDDPNCGDPMTGTFSVEECQELVLDLECDQGDPQIRKYVDGIDRVTLQAGARATYTLEYSNESNQTLTNVVISDPFDNENQRYIKFISQTSSPSVQFEESTMSWTIGELAPGDSGVISIEIEVLNESNLPNNSLEILNDFRMTWDGGELTSNEVEIIVPYSAQTGAGMIIVIVSIVIGGGIAVVYILSKQGFINLLKK